MRKKSKPVTRSIGCGNVSEVGRQRGQMVTARSNFNRTRCRHSERERERERERNRSVNFHALFVSMCRWKSIKFSFNQNKPKLKNSKRTNSNDKQNPTPESNLKLSFPKLKPGITHNKLPEFFFRRREPKVKSVNHPQQFTRKFMKNPQWKAMNNPPQISATHHNPQTQPQPPKNPATHRNPQTQPLATHCNPKP